MAKLIFSHYLSYTYLNFVKTWDGTLSTLSKFNTFSTIICTFNLICQIIEIFKKELGNSISCNDWAKLSNFISCMYSCNIPLLTGMYRWFLLSPLSLLFFLTNNTIITTTTAPSANTASVIPMISPVDKPDKFSVVVLFVVAIDVVNSTALQ